MVLYKPRSWCTFCPMGTICLLYTSGKKKVIDEIVKCMEEHADNGINYNGKCFISQSACLEDAKKVSALVEEKFKNLNGNVVINNIGTVIGSHTGPGTVALFFWGDERTE